VTTLTNPWRALLRFDIGDLARLTDEPCPCGRDEGFTLASIEGRTINLTCTPDKRAVTMGQVDRALAQVEGLVEYQLLQTAPDRYSLAVVVEGASPARVTDEARCRLRVLYGAQARICARVVEAIAPDPPGKYRLVKNTLVPELAELIDPLYAPPTLEESHE